MTAIVCIFPFIVIAEPRGQKLVAVCKSNVSLGGHIRIQYDVMSWLDTVTTIEPRSTYGSGERIVPIDRSNSSSLYSRITANAETVHGLVHRHPGKHFSRCLATYHRRLFDVKRFVPPLDIYRKSK